MSTTEDRRAHYIVMLGSCCDGARLGGMSIRVELEDGTVVEGVPTATPVGDARDRQLDHTGMNPYLQIDRTLVKVADVRSYCVQRPG